MDQVQKKDPRHRQPLQGHTGTMTLQDAAVRTDDYFRFSLKKPSILS